ALFSVSTCKSKVNVGEVPLFGFISLIVTGPEFTSNFENTLAEIPAREIAATLIILFPFVTFIDAVKILLSSVMKFPFDSIPFIIMLCIVTSLSNCTLNKTEEEFRTELFEGEIFITGGFVSTAMSSLKGELMKILFEFFALKERP